MWICVDLCGSLICLVFLPGLFWSGPVKRELGLIKTEAPNSKPDRMEAGSVNLS